MNEINKKLLHIDLGFTFVWDGIIFKRYILGLENLEALDFVRIKTLQISIYIALSLEQYTPCIVTSQWRCDVTVL